jgi:betaine reductase
MPDPAILASHYILAHGPDFVRYGSKPTREIESSPELLGQLTAALRPWEEVLAYPPNQTFIGNLTPDDLAAIPRPWTEHPVAAASAQGRFGRMIPQAALYGLMKLCDEFDLIAIDEALAAEARSALEGGFSHRLDRIVATPAAELDALLAAGSGLPLYHDGRTAGFLKAVHEQDASLDAHVLFENLACKATAVLAVAGVLAGRGLDPAAVDWLLNTGEEAVGEVVGCINATGYDIKAFCSAPVHGLITAAAMVAAGLHEYVVVLGGGSQAKMGMKFRAHLRNGVPVMEDCLAGMAFIVGPDDGTGMRLRLDLTGRHPIGAGSSPQAIYQALVIDPLDRAGLKMTDIGRYAVEMHNPEITEPGDSGDVPRTNYRTLAAMAVLRGEIARDQMEEFTTRHGMPGFAPTQGHIPAGVPYLGHAQAAMHRGELQSAMIVAKGSLFLGRMTQLVDGVSFVVEPGSKTTS